MSPSARSTPPPDEPTSDAELEDERSTIRTRVLRPSAVPAAVEQRPHTPPSSHDSGARRLRLGRIDLKVRIAQVLLEDLPPGEPQARLLRVAIVRRDETLIDAILAELATRFGR